MKEIKTMKAVRISGIAALAVTVCLSACGQKGPLTLPKQPIPESQPAPVPTKPTSDISEQLDHQG